jgi:hypothetical protein
VSRRVDEVAGVVFAGEVGQEEGDGHGLDGQLPVLLVNPAVQPAVVLLQIPVWLAQVGLLDEKVHDSRLAVVQVSRHADVASTVGVSQQVQQVLRFVVCLQVLLVVVALISLSGDEGSFEGLAILLLNHDFRPWIHLLVALVELLVLVQHDAVLVGDWQHLLYPVWNFFLVLGLLF